MLKILGITSSTRSVVSVLMNVPSRAMGGKDVVKVEGMELDPEDVDSLALVAPGSTVNIIRDYEVVQKFRVDMPGKITGLLKCGNPNCISNTNEPVRSRFVVESEEPVRLRCSYCEFVLEKDIADHLL